MNVAPIDPSAIPSDLPSIELPAGDVPIEGKLASVTLEIPNGLLVEVGPPPVFTINLLSQIFADNEKFDQIAFVYAKAAMWVLSINGVPQPRPTSKPELQQLQNKLLDDGLEQVIQAMNEFFPAVTKENLKVVKKNLR